MGFERIFALSAEIADAMVRLWSGEDVVECGISGCVFDGNSKFTHLPRKWSRADMVFATRGELAGETESKYFKTTFS